MSYFLVIQGPEGSEYMAEVKAFQAFGKPVKPADFALILEGGRYVELRDSSQIYYRDGKWVPHVIGSDAYGDHEVQPGDVVATSEGRRFAALDVQRGQLWWHYVGDEQGEYSELVVEGRFKREDLPLTWERIDAALLAELEGEGGLRGWDVGQDA